MQRILVVDDAEINRELLRNILEDEYEVDLAVDGEEAVGKLREHQNQTAAVLLDLHMPKMDGLTVISRLKKRDGCAGFLCWWSAVSKPRRLRRDVLRWAFQILSTGRSRLLL